MKATDISKRNGEYLERDRSLLDRLIAHLTADGSVILMDWIVITESNFLKPYCGSKTFKTKVKNKSIYEFYCFLCVKL